MSEVSAIKMRKVEDYFCHKRDDEVHRKREKAGEDWDNMVDASYDWDPSPGTSKGWKRQITSGKLNRMFRQATRQPFVPQGLMKQVSRRAREKGE